MRKAITLSYTGSANATLLYGPEIAYPTQKAGVKSAINVIVNNSSGSGFDTYYEIWVNGTVKNYKAKYATTTPKSQGNWSTVHGQSINVKNQLG